MLEIIIAPSSVQGDEAPSQLIKALSALDTLEEIDVIILARGGGSLEDLWAFNNEDLIRTISELKTPIITGVGHETDFTLADFAADLRAPTPTGAAALAVPELSEFQEQISTINNRLEILYNTWIANRKFTLEALSHRLQRTSPDWQIQNNRQKIDEMHHRSRIAIKNLFTSHTNNLDALNNRLMGLDPKSVLNRGYAVLSDENGKWIQSAKQVKEKIPINVRMADGKFVALPEKPELE